MDINLYKTTSIPEFLKRDYAAFLESCGLRAEYDNDFTAMYQTPEGKILACGSRHGNVLKQIAVSPEEEGRGLCAQLVSELVDEAVGSGESHLFLYTKPENEKIFSGLGFYSLVSTDEILMMENRKDGLRAYLESLPHPKGLVGAVVCNCNPFTLGHRKLIEFAAANCDQLMVFVLSEDLSMFSSQDRYTMVKEGTADIKNVHVVFSKDYLISRATFPTYFIKEQARCTEAVCQLDIKLFAARIAPALNISLRFVGEEPFDMVTKSYNEAMKATLPAYNIQVIEIPRFENISASKVRKLILEGRVRETKKFLPETSYEYCLRHFGTST